jgi:Ca-activated chloride channel family protein
VIEKTVAKPEAGDDNFPRSGALMAKLRPDTPPEQMQPCPLKHTDMKASIAGYIASVDVTQQFHNPFSEKIEAVYVFPLPANAAVNDFVMTIGERRIRGVIREREQAKRIYEDAKRQGFVASLLTQERPNIFTQSVANIEPGKQIDISIRYFHTLTYSDGWYELVFPMVVGPRFNPPGTSGGIGAVGTSDRGATGQRTEISYLRPGTRNGHDIGLEVTLDPGVFFSEIRSVNHDVVVELPDGKYKSGPVRTWEAPDHSFPTKYRPVLRLAAHDAVPNKDFILRWKPADAIQSSIVAAHTEAGGYFSMMILPPADLGRLPRMPLEFVFTLDVSGSMGGRPIEQAKQAMLYALQRMGPQDRFQVVKFADSAELMAPQPVPATPENIDRAMRYVSSMSAGGGTMMLDGMRKSLDFPRDPERMRIVAFLTDGYIGNEAQILGAMRGWIGDSRVFSFGVGQAPNRYLLDHMAKLGRGAAGYVSLNDNPDEVMAKFFDRASHPAMTDVRIDFGGMAVRDVFPRQIPDLFVGRPILLTGTFTGVTDGTIRITGRVNGETQTLLIPVRRADAAMTRALPSVWARSKISDLADEATYRPGVDLPGQIKQIALEYGLMSSFTAFIAVDASRRTEGDHGITTHVPVPVPDGVRYDTTVMEKPRAQRGPEGD